MNKKNKGKSIGAFSNTSPSIKIFFLLIFFIAIYLAYPVKVLETKNYKTGEYVKSWKVKDGETFYVEHTHSVQLTPVTEKYRIDGEDIVLLEAKFHSYGAGLPATTPYDFELVEDGFRIYNINTVMDNLVYRAGATRANHRIIIHDKLYKFLDFSKPRVGLKFNVKHVARIKYLIEEGLM